MSMQVNAFDRNRLEEPDYDSRLGAFREVVWWDYEKCPQSLLVAIIHNSYYTLRYVSSKSVYCPALYVLHSFTYFLYKYVIYIFNIYIM